MRSAAEPEWEECKAPDGRLYYYNTKTKTSSWEKPADFTPASGSSRDSRRDDRDSRRDERRDERRDDRRDERRDERRDDRRDDNRDTRDQRRDVRDAHHMSTGSADLASQAHAAQLSILDDALANL